MEGSFITGEFPTRKFMGSVGGATLEEVIGAEGTTRFPSELLDEASQHRSSKQTMAGTWTMPASAIHIVARKA